MEQTVAAKENKSVCNCDDLIVIKKGFSGAKAVSGFLILFAVCASVIFLVFRYEESNIEITKDINSKYGLSTEVPNYLFINIILLSLASVIVLLGLFRGTIGMNDLYSVCPKCGKKLPLDK